MPRAAPVNRTRYWCDRHIHGLSLLHADFTAHDYPPHSHDAFVVAITEHGGSIIRSRGTEEEAHTSELFVFNPAEPHAGRMGTSRRWHYRSLYLTRQAIDEVARILEVADLPYFLANKIVDPDLVAGFSALHRALETDCDPFLERERLVAAFGGLFARHGGVRHDAGGAADHPALVRTIELMRARFAEPLLLDDLATEAGLSSFQLISLFKRRTGLTPHAYLTQLRLGAACRLMRRGTRIADAAADTGFYDQSALTGHFRRCYGITPRQFVQAARA